MHSTRELQDQAGRATVPLVPPLVLAGRARAAYRPARSPAPVVALRAACAGLAVLIHVMRGTAATSDGEKGTVRARSYWCGGGESIPRGRWLRERDRVRYGRIGFRISVGGSDHRDWLRAHAAVRRATISFFCRISERGRDIPQHARLGPLRAARCALRAARCALAGGRARKWHLRGELKSRKRAPVVCCRRRASAVSPSSGPHDAHA